MTDTLEVRLLRWSDNSNSGQTVTFLLPEGEVHPFKGLRYGKTGERFAMALARIEDEQTKADHVFIDGYVEGSKPEKTEGAKCRDMAHALCADPAFHDFLEKFHPNWWVIFHKGTRTETVARILRQLCGVESRADFAVNPAACEKLRALEFEFRHRDTRR